MDYTILVADKTVEGSIKNWINWNIAPATTILTQAQAMVYSRLRVKEMLRYKQDGEILLNASSMTMPSDYIAIKKWKRIGTNSGRIWVLDPDHWMNKRQRNDDGTMVAGTPQYAMIQGGSDPANPITAHFDVKADQDYDWEMIYYGRPTPLGVSNTQNFLTDRYEWLLRSACLYQGYLYKGELDMAAPHEKAMNEWFERAEIERDMERQSEEFQPWAIGDGDNG